MISVQDIVSDADMASPDQWIILRSTATFGWGGVTSVTSEIPLFGPVRVASNREIEMLPEADRVGSIRAFYSTIPLYVTRGTQQVPYVIPAVIDGSFPGTSFTLNAAPPGGTLQLVKNGLTLIPDVDYSLDVTNLTMYQPVLATDGFWGSWIGEGNQAGLSDQIQYRNEIYRLVQVYRTQGSGFWKGIANRENPS